MLCLPKMIQFLWPFISDCFACVVTTELALYVTFHDVMVGFLITYGCK